MSKTLGQIAYEAAMSDLAGPWADKADQVKLVWEAGAKAVAERCAQIAKDHDAGRDRRSKYRPIKLSSLSPEAQAEIAAEERGESIAAEIIHREITALINGGEDA